MITTLIFDLDGTLLNTIEDLMISTNYALETFGYPPHTLDEIKTYVGSGVKVLMERILPFDHFQGEYYGFISLAS